MDKTNASPRPDRTWAWALVYSGVIVSANPAAPWIARDVIYLLLEQQAISERPGGFLKFSEDMRQACEMLGAPQSMEGLHGWLRGTV